MTDFLVIPLKDLLDEMGEDVAKTILSGFSCPKNYDVEHFIREDAINFSKQYWAGTFLVFSYSEETGPVLEAYFALSNKIAHVKPDQFSRTMVKKICSFSDEYRQHKELEYYPIPAILISQLAKNESSNYKISITGDQLMSYILDKVEEIQKQIGGRLVFLDCDDNTNLRSYYERNGFNVFNTRESIGKNGSTGKPHLLVQMLKYMK